MAEVEKLTDQIDRLLAEHRYEDEGAWYDGREETLLEVRRLAKAHVCGCDCEGSLAEMRDDISSIIQDLKKLL